MAIPTENYLLIPLSIGFAGSLSFGPVNLCVVDTTVRHNLQAGLWFAIAAALVEGAQSFLALAFGQYYPVFLRQYPWVHLVVLAFFVVLGVAFLRRSKSSGSQGSAQTRGGRHFAQGLVIATMNPQGIPFWILVLTYLQSVQWFEISAKTHRLGIGLFLVGVVVGKFGALSLFSLLSNTINRRTAFLQQWTDKITGGVLIALGLLQGLQYFLS